MTLGRLVPGLLLSLVLPQTVSSGKNCDHPNSRVNIGPDGTRDGFVTYEAVITSDTNPPYATSTISVPVGTFTTTGTETKSVTEFFLDAGCVVSSGSSIYTLTASATVTQDAANPVSFWVRSLCLESFAQQFFGTLLTLEFLTGPIEEIAWNKVDTTVCPGTDWYSFHCRPEEVQRLR